MIAPLSLKMAKTIGESRWLNQPAYLVLKIAFPAQKEKIAQTSWCDSACLISYLDSNQAVQIGV